MRGLRGEIDRKDSALKDLRVSIKKLGCGMGEITYGSAGRGGGSSTLRKSL